jgi:hypothetical protein
LVLATAIFVVLINCASGDVWINEIMANPIDSCSDCSEWIEIYSNSSRDMINWTINTTNEQINFSFYIEDFLIITRNKSAFMQIWPNVNESKIINWSYMSLLNGGESIFLFDSNSQLISNITYPSFDDDANKTYSKRLDSNWTICNLPTPSANNSCQQQTCIQNWSCSAWGTCTSGAQTRTCTDLNNCSNITGKPAENQSCSSSSDIYLELEYEDEVQNGEEFEVEVKAYYLEDEDYDIKVYVTSEEDTIISETYDETDDDWSSSNYYINEIVSGPGNKTVTFKLRIDSGYEDFKGEAKINAKIKKNGGSAIDDVTADIEILEKEEDGDEGGSSTTSTTATTQTSTTTSSSSNSTNSSTDEIVKLNTKKQENIKTSGGKVLYRSKAEYFKDYGIYGFAFVCIIIIIVLLIKP